MGFGGGGSSGAAQSPILLPSTAEVTQAFIVDDNSSGPGTAGTARIYGQPFTVGSTSKFWLITGISWKNGAAVAGNILCGIDKVQANVQPPVNTDNELVAYTSDVAQAGINTTQRNSVVIQTRPLGVGEIITPWINSTNITAAFRYQTVAAENNERLITDSRTFPTWKSAAAWVTLTTRWAIQLHITGYG